MSGKVTGPRIRITLYSLLGLMMILMICTLCNLNWDFTDERHEG
jgi:hypothetical protein